MVDVNGRCTKCRRTTVVSNPGVVCVECKGIFHGGCLVPAVGITELKALANTPEGWRCKPCARSHERIVLKMKTHQEESAELKHIIDLIAEVKELLELSETALEQLMERLNELVKKNKHLQQENLILSKRLAQMDGHYKLKVEFLQKIVNKKPMNKTQYLENAIKLAQTQSEKGKKEDGDETNITKDFDTFAKYAGLNKGERAAYAIKGKFSKYSKAWFTHIFLFLCLVIYTCVGGVIFHYLEKDAPQKKPMDRPALVNLYTGKVRNHIDEIQEVTTVQTNFPENAEELLREYEHAIRAWITYEGKVSRGDDEMYWHYFSSVFFCSTVYTTIGYGHMFPNTFYGQIAVILYATFGVPLFLIALADFGSALTRLIKYFWNFFRRCHQTGSWRKKKSSKFSEEEEFRLPIWIALLIELIYIFAGSWLFHMWEGWGFLDSFYFVFDSVATIGYGDFVPQNTFFMMPAMFYLLFGLSISSMAINVVREKIIETMDRASAKLGQTLDLMVEEIETD